MKKALIVLMALLIIASGLSAQSYVGINLKGSEGYEPMVSLEAGYDTGIISPYLQIGLLQGSALVGANVKIGSSPVIAFIGAGVTLAEQVEVTEYSVPVESTGEVVTRVRTKIYYYNYKIPHVHGRGKGYGDVTTSGTADFTVTDTHLIPLPSAEIGVGIDMSHLITKIGYSYIGNGVINNHGFSVSMGYSF